MKGRSNGTLILILVFSLLISGCGSGQLSGPTFTPSPTATSTPPSLTPTVTTTPTIIATFTPEPTATNTPLPVCKLEVFSSKDLKDLGPIWTMNPKSDGERTMIIDDDVSVSKLVNSKGDFYLLQIISISKTGNYLISVDAKRNSKFTIQIFDQNYTKKSFEGWSIQANPKMEYTTVAGSFVIKQAPVSLLVEMGASSNQGYTTNVWLKNLQICLTE